MRLYWNKTAEEWQDTPPPRPAKSGLQIIPDLEPYRNVIDGKVIGGRRQHRDFLRAHGCIEVGNERVQSKPAPLPDVDQAVRQAFAQLGHGD